MSERFKVQISKICVGETPPWVQIPLPPVLFIISTLINKGKYGTKISI